MTKKTLVLALALLMPFCAANASHDEYIYAGPRAPFRYHQWIDDKTGTKMIEVQRLSPDQYDHSTQVIPSSTPEEVEREKAAEAQQKEAIEQIAKKNKFEDAGENSAYRFYRNPVTNQKMTIDRKTGKRESRD